MSGRRRVPRLGRCGCGRAIRSVAKRFAQCYDDASSTRELTAHLQSMRPTNTNEADERDLRTSQEKIDGLIDALRRVLHDQPRRTDATYIDRLRRPRDALSHG